jgi:hypothetical protein
MRRSNVLSLPFQLGFPAPKYLSKDKNGAQYYKIGKDRAK